MLNIVERFITISGEAPIIGHPVYIYRFSECNLDCSYCDTQYKNEVNLTVSKDEIVDDIRAVKEEYPQIKVLFTGGEPLLGERREQISYIVNLLSGIEFYIETNGTIEIIDNDRENCHFVCDYKSPSANEKDMFFQNNLKTLIGEKDCIKFVVNGDDLDWLSEKIKYVNKVNSSLPIFVSPVHSKLEFEKLAEFILERKLPVNISIQLHKIIWPNIERGK